MTNSIGEIADAAAILAIGTNTTAAHPVIWLQIKKAIDRGAKLVVANPRRIPLADRADIWLQQRPGSDVALLMGLARIILEEGLADEKFIAERCEHFDEFKASLEQYDIDFVTRETGVPADQLRAAARLYAENSPASILYTMGITQHTHGTDNVMAIANLAMLTGNVGIPSAGVNPLRGQNNVQGACDMGALPNVYTGYQKVVDAAVREKFQTAWGAPLSAEVGLAVTEVIPAVHQGKVKALYIVGENPVLSDADISHVEEAMEKVDFLVVQDIFLTETAAYADVVLPASSFLEKDGTFTNTERRVQRVRKVFEPVGESRDDWWIAAEIAKRMGGQGFDYATAEDVMAEISQVTPSYGGISYARLEGESPQWPCPDSDHPGTCYLHAQQFSRGKGHFMPIEYRASAELPDADYPLMLTTERSLYHYHTGTMTRKVDGLNKLRAEELVEINPADATALGVTDGETVSVASRRGQVSARAWVTDVTPPGVVTMSFHFAESPTNRLTNPALDPVAKIPEFKVCAVKVAKGGD
jgi:formate dehydrogenase alpha subunit